MRLNIIKILDNIEPSLFENQYFNYKTLSEESNETYMPDLESEESAAEVENQGKGLKILTPDQMLSRLPTTLAQLNAGNNSEKLKNEIRQLLYSL